MDKFTKGDWSVRKVSGFDYGDYYNGVGVCDVHGRTQTVLSASNLSIHDARLIAQSPKMHETLKQAREFIASDENCGPCGLGLVCMIDELLNECDKD